MYSTYKLARVWDPMSEFWLLYGFELKYKYYTFIYFFKSVFSKIVSLFVGKRCIVIKLFEETRRFLLILLYTRLHVFDLRPADVYHRRRLE